MSPPPASFLQHLRAEGYHPRSDKHSNALAEAIVADLVAHCPAIRDRARRGDVVFDLNFTLMAGTADWNVDLVLGSPSLGAAAPAPASAIGRASPSRVEIAIELKAVMTEHRKAIKNRKRDLEAHHEHVHRYDRDAIAAGVMIINAAPRFSSPLRAKETVTVHREPESLVRHCIAEVRAVAERQSVDGVGLDAKCALVLSFDNIERSRGAYVKADPAPRTGDPLHYDAFIRTICRLYEQRFGR